MAYVFRAYPKWLHQDGHKSVLVETAEDEAAQLAEWGDTYAAARTPVCNQLIGASLHVGDRLTFETSPSPGGETEAVVTATVEGGARKGGWPKGKPRKPANTARVN